MNPSTPGVTPLRQRMLDDMRMRKLEPKTQAGVRTFLVRYTVKGSGPQRQYRLQREYGDGAGQIKLAAACAEAMRIRALAREGVDWPAREEARLRG
jgi:hypothetical protein